MPEQHEHRANIYSFEEAKRRREEKKSAAAFDAKLIQSQEVVDMRSGWREFLDDVAISMRQHFSDTRAALSELRTVNMMRAAVVETDSLLEHLDANLENIASETNPREQLEDITSQARTLQTQVQALRMDTYFTDLSAPALTLDQMQKYLDDVESFISQL